MSQYRSQERPGLRISVILFLLTFWGTLLFCGARNVQESQAINRAHREQVLSATAANVKKGADQITAHLDGLRERVLESLLQERKDFPGEVEAVWVWGQSPQGPPEQGIFPGFGLRALSPELEAQVRERLITEGPHGSFWAEAGLVLTGSLPSGKRYAFLVQVRPEVLLSGPELQSALVDPSGQVRVHTSKNMNGGRTSVHSGVRATRTLEGRAAAEALWPVRGYPLLYQSEGIFRPIYRKVIRLVDLALSLGLGLFGLAVLALLQALVQRRRAVSKSALSESVRDALALLASQASDREVNLSKKEHLVRALPAQPDRGLNRDRLLEMLSSTEADHAQDPITEVSPNHPTEPSSSRGE